MRGRRYRQERAKQLNPLLRFLLLILLAVLCFAPLLFIYYLRDHIALSDPEVIAMWTSASLFWCFPLVFYWLITMFMLFLPLIDKNCSREYQRPCYGINAAKRRRKIGVILWSIGFVLVLMISLLSLFGRECLTRDGRLQRYNMFNQLVDEYAPDEVNNIHFRAWKRTGRGSAYLYSVELYTDGDEFYFHCGSFYPDEHGTLQELLTIRERYEPNVTVDATPQLLEKVVRNRELSEEEAALLYQLFEETP